MNKWVFILALSHIIVYPKLSSQFKEKVCASGRQKNSETETDRLARAGDCILSRCLSGSEHVYTHTCILSAEEY